MAAQDPQYAEWVPVLNEMLARGIRLDSRVCNVGFREGNGGFSFMGIFLLVLTTIKNSHEFCFYPVCHEKHPYELQ